MYLSQSKIAADPAMHERVAQCAAEQNAPGDADSWTFNNRREYSAAPGWAAAWESAEAGGNPDPGSDPAVITDGMILTQVQAMLMVGPA